MGAEKGSNEITKQKQQKKWSNLEMVRKEGGKEKTVFLLTSWKWKERERERETCRKMSAIAQSSNYSIKQ